MGHARCLSQQHLVREGKVNERVSHGRAGTQYVSGCMPGVHPLTFSQNAPSPFPWASATPTRMATVSQPTIPLQGRAAHAAEPARTRQGSSEGEERQASANSEHIRHRLEAKTARTQKMIDHSSTLRPRDVPVRPCTSRPAPVGLPQHLPPHHPRPPRLPRTYLAHWGPLRLQ